MISGEIIKDILRILAHMGHIRGNVDVDQVYSELYSMYEERAKKLSFGQDTSVTTDYDAGDEIAH